MAPHRGHCQGFTLMEMMIGIVLIGILTIVAVPNIERFSSGYKLRGAAREVATDLQYAKMMAIKENQSFQVFFGTQSYQVKRGTGGGAVTVKSRSLAMDYPNVTIDATANPTFSSRGLCNGATINLNLGASTKTITVAFTGRIKLS
ncbi:MAG: GspH/FimT family pseudopilin [Deltaproteobacteria bacterium]|nr:GspH/FimT family pseudopilin [Deltaproteobacteria bacterium]